MKKYRVNVNGEAYEIEIELMEESAVAPAVKASNNTPAPSVAGGMEKIESPMPGTILSVNVKNGDSVKKGDVLFILEAMKMENEIMAPRDAKVVSVETSKGASVSSGAVLCTIE